MKINNKDLIQSYILTTAKYDFNVHEKRVLYRIIEVLQSLTKGKKLNYTYQCNPTLFESNQFVMPLRVFLKEEDNNNHKFVREAFSSLQKKIISFEDDRVWRSAGIVFNVKIEKYSEDVTFYVADFIYNAFLDFSRGYSKYELATAMSFESIYAMRFYELLSGQTKPITYNIDNLKIMFKIEDKYVGRPSDFIKNVIMPAKKELDKSSPYSFEYKPVKTGRKITAIKFYPIYQPDNRDNRIEAKRLTKNTSLRWDLDRLTITYLKENYLFSEDEIQNNRELFVSAQNSSTFDLLYFLSEQKRNAEKKKNPKGWIINAIKKQLAQGNEK